jgi:drug/metabolite transporter (DMT)-like permease
MKVSRRRNVLAHVLLLAVVLVWGTTFPLVKSALGEVSPLLFNLLRMLLAFVALAAVNASALRGVSWQDLRFGGLAGLFLALGYQFQTSGLALTTPSKSAFITGLVVVMVPLLSGIPGVSPHHSKPGSAAYVGAGLAFGGLVLLTTVPGARLLSGMGWGEGLSLICAVAFAAHLLSIARAAPLVNARRLGTLQIGFAALTMLVTLPLGGRLRFHATPTVWWALAITALLATAAAFTIQSWAQQHLPASHTALIFTMEPVFAWLFSLLFLGERLGPRALAGAGLILAGILLAELLQAGPTPG